MRWKLSVVFNKRKEGLHDAIRTYARTILHRCLVSFDMARYREKQQKTLELLIYFAERFKNIAPNVCVLLLCYNVVLCYDLNKK